MAVAPILALRMLDSDLWPTAVYGKTDTGSRLALNLGEEFPW